jgi:hypothetical protein
MRREDSSSESIRSFQVRWRMSCNYLSWRLSMKSKYLSIVNGLITLISRITIFQDRDSKLFFKAELTMFSKYKNRSSPARLLMQIITNLYSLQYKMYKRNLKGKSWSHKKKEFRKLIKYDAMILQGIRVTILLRSMIRKTIFKIFNNKISNQFMKIRWK